MKLLQRYLILGDNLQQDGKLCAKIKTPVPQNLSCDNDARYEELRREGKLNCRPSVDMLLHYKRPLIPDVNTELMEWLWFTRRFGAAVSCTVQ
jgi:hypothetical protein